jgi:plasmid replication initiation protein
MLDRLEDVKWYYEDDEKWLKMRWIASPEINKNTDIVRFKFQENLAPFLFDLARNEKFTTNYKLKYILPMKSMYAPRLYEILKSYSNRNDWIFQLDELKTLLNAEKYAKFKDFKKRVLIPSENDINAYSDLIITYREIKKGNKVVAIKFYIDLKTQTEKRDTWDEINKELDGQTTIEGFLNNFEVMNEEVQFLAERREKHKEEQEEQAKRKKKFLPDNEE